MLAAVTLVAASHVDAVAVSAIVDGTSGAFRFPVTPQQARGTFAVDEAAWASFNDSYDAIGWSLLEVHGNPNMEDAVVARAAGVLEGKLTAHRILQAAINHGCGPGVKPDPNVTNFFAVHDRWASAMGGVSKQSSAAEAAYWHHFSLVDVQLRGLHEGYGLAVNESGGALPPLPFESVLYLNLGEELEQFAGFRPGVGVGQRLPTFGTLEPFEAANKCSALVRLTPGSRDLLIAQETWSSLSSMLRIYKMYDLPYTLRGGGGPAAERVPARRVSFSSYPGVLNSGDDFYVTSAGLVVQETTIGNSNPELVRAYVSPLTVPEWKRNIVANRLAATGFDWSGIYARYSTCTRARRPFAPLPSRSCSPPSPSTPHPPHRTLDSHRR